ncbi:hypothetical protein [Nocardiopsis sp. FR4]|uniref:hypothetical protein n=1 Tax=Nocardiopsis sp. FR4 TaxID=2605985 RepID=UPI00135687D1|nr:hypothetical protein [Nocardiopsis sp. FR4]
MITRQIPFDVAHALNHVVDLGQPHAGYTPIDLQHDADLPDGREEWILIVQRTDDGTHWALPLIGDELNPKFVNRAKQTVTAHQVTAVHKTEYVAVQPTKAPSYT